MSVSARQTVIISDQTLWFSTREIAALCLTGIPHDRRRVSDMVKAEGWATRTTADGALLSRPRAKRGGGVEYHYSLLPKRAQNDVIEKISRRAMVKSQRPAPSSRTVVRRALAAMAPDDRKRFLLRLLAKELRG